MRGMLRHRCTVKGESSTVRTSQGNEKTVWGTDATGVRCRCRAASAADVMPGGGADVGVVTHVVDFEPSPVDGSGSSVTVNARGKLLNVTDEQGTVIVAEADIMTVLPVLGLGSVKGLRARVKQVV